MLFAVPAPPVVAETSDSDAVTQQVEHRVSAMNKIHDVLAMVHPSVCVHWLSDGEWSAHDLLLGLVQLSGPADVWLSSYGMSEYPARLMADLKTRGIIKRLVCLIDSRIDKTGCICPGTGS